MSTNNTIEAGFWMVPKFVVVDGKTSLEEAMLLGVLITRMNGENPAWPSHQHLASTIGRCPRNIRKYLSNLQKNGYISISSGQEEGKTNKYLVNPDVLLSVADKVGRGRPTNPVADDRQKKQIKNPFPSETCVGVSDVPPRSPTAAPDAPTPNVGADIPGGWGEFVKWHYELYKAGGAKLKYGPADVAAVKRFLKSNTLDDAKAVVIWWRDNGNDSYGGPAPMKVFSAASLSKYAVSNAQPPAIVVPPPEKKVKQVVQRLPNGSVRIKYVDEQGNEINPKSVN